MMSMEPVGMEIRLAADRHQHTPANYERWRSFPILTLFMDGQRNWLPDSELPAFVRAVRRTRDAGFRVKLRSCCKMRYEHEHGVPWDVWGPKALERLTKLLKALPGVEEWQVMNEPNLLPPWERADWEAYFELAREGCDLIKAANPEAIVVLAGINDGGVQWKMTGETFFETLCRVAYEHGEDLPCDRVSMHTWRAGWDMPFQRWHVIRDRGILQMLRNYRAILDLYGFGDIPLEIGECGKTVVCGEHGCKPWRSEEDQREFMRAVVTAAHQAGIHSITWWDWAGTTADPKVSPLIFNGEPRLALFSFVGFCGAFNA